MTIYRNDDGRWILSINNPDVVDVVRCKDGGNYCHNCGAKMDERKEDAD